MKKTILAAALLALLAAFALVVFSDRTPQPDSTPPAPESRASASAQTSTAFTPRPPISADSAALASNAPAPGPSPVLLAQAAASPSDAPAAQQSPSASPSPPSAQAANSSAITTADQAAAFFAGAKTPSDLLEKADLSNPVVREFVVARMSEMEEARYESVVEKANRLGIPLRIEGPGNKVSVLHDFDGDRPVYRTTQNRNAAISSGANLLAPAPYNLNGSGVKVGVWDAGSVRNTHREFNTTRVVKRNSSVAVDDHATHVAGTIGANGTTANAKGMAPLAAIDSYDWNSDYAEMTAAGAATSSDTAKLPVSNHSYGYNAASTDMGRYEDECVTTDNLAHGLPYYLIFWAAGNEQDLLTAKGGYQSITFNGLAKNILTVGAVNDAVSGGVRSPSAGTMSTFSSWGPCDDGRIKPDVVANGVSVYSPVSTGDSAYDTYNGTSMATPSAAGSAALLVQLYAREFSNQRLRASMLKGLLIHTADDLGNPGPDYQNGWGLINVKAAADLILAHKASLAAPKMIEGTLNNSTKTTTHSFQWDGTSPIRATLCWTEPAGARQTAADSRTPNLRHNLDLQITSPNGTTTLPFVMPFVGNWTDSAMSLPATRGKNNVDTVEQVLIASPGQAGAYTVTVSLTGNLTTASQAYSLIVTGGTDVETNPPPNLTLDSPASGTAILANSPVALTATATDKTLGGANGTIQSVQFFSGTTSLGIDTTAPYSASWTPANAGTYSLTAVATDTEGASATSTAATVFVLSGNGAPAITSFSPASGRAGDVVTINGTNFADIASVRFNGIEAQFTTNSTTLLAATVPAGASSGPITITNTFGNATSASSFTILQNPVLISQAYGAGGNGGALYNADFVELHNRGNATVSLSGWSIQYASATGTTWAATPLTGSIAPGKYHLVKLSGGTTGAALPTPDSTGNSNMSGTNGKIALRDSTTPFTGASPAGQSGLQDFVGFGAATAYEGSGAAPAPSATASIFRAGGGATDTGDNKNDFTTGTPNPRNSSFGSASPPSITSPGTASGTVGQSFSYQIAASNSPTSFNATGLPAGLAVNTSTGLVSGTPSLAGTTNATLSATNSAGTANATLAITITQSGGGGGGGIGTTIFNEDFSSITAGDNTSTGGSSSVWTPNVNFSSVSRAYQAGGAVKLGTSSASGSITTKSLNLSAGSYTVSFKVKGWTNIEGNITVTPSSGSAQTVSYSANMTAPFESKSLSFTGGTASTNITIATTAKRAFIDDVVITTGGSAPTPALTANSSLAALSTPYGNASASSTFTVSGTNIASGILVTAPPGFELSQTANGTSGYAPTQTLAGTGTLGPATLHLRLAAGIAADSYGGSIICSSQGATSVSLAVPISTVRQKLLTVTASNRTKPFGQTLALGTSAFTSSGLVGNETIGSVTLAANGGTQSADPVGTYEITPSAATGGTFSPFNYDILYQPGTLTVTAPTFSDWASGLTNPAPNADPDRDGIPNLLEYFLGLDANLPSSAGIVFDAGDGVLSMDYPRSKALSGSSGRVEWTSDFSGWSTANVTDSLLTENATHETRRATVPVESGDSKKFLRLRVTTP